MATTTVIGNVIKAVTNNIATIKSAIGDATTSAAGLMTTTQVTKLNGIAAGATKNTIVNNLTATTAGSALDAVQGKALSDQISALNSSMTTRSSNLTKCKISNTDESNRLFLIDFEGDLLGGAAGYARIQFIVMTDQIVVNCKNSDGAWTKVATYTAN